MEDLNSSLKYKRWAKALADNGIDLRGVEDLKTIRKGSGEILFSMVKIDAISPEGKPLLPIALLRGHFVAVLMSLIDRQSGQEHFLMIRQRRVATGQFMLEHPAGMVDSSMDPFEVALTEVREETGLQIRRDQLILLNEKVLYSSPGLLDEGGYFFAARLEMSREEIEALDDNAQGHGSEGEFIQTVVMSREAAVAETCVANAILHFFLWEQWQRENESGSV